MSSAHDVRHVRMDKFFPGTVADNFVGLIDATASPAEERLIEAVIDEDTVRWALNFSKPYKSAGRDGDLRALIQNALHNSSVLCWLPTYTSAASGKAMSLNSGRPRESHSYRGR